MSQRTERIDELLRQEIGQALERDLADPGIGFVTVTDVETSPDLAHARVWVSVIGTEEQRRETLAALRRAMPYVRHGLNSKIRLRRIPELDVRLDESIERGTRVLHLINELESGRDPEEAAAPLESLPTPVPRLPHEGDMPEPGSAALPALKPTHKPGRRQATGHRVKPGSKAGPKAGPKSGRGDGRRGSR
jgi:ribosome-binding factor A